MITTMSMMILRFLIRLLSSKSTQRTQGPPSDYQLLQQKVMIAQPSLYTLPVQRLFFELKLNKIKIY